MGERAAVHPALEVSVSFGRFENDTLSWEKWSAFSQNKYLEEVEKCATPGSVAMKKAYFEAHYKKIAAQKADLLGEEKPMEKGPLRSDDQNGEDLADNSYGTESEVHVSNCKSSSEEVKQEISLIDDVGMTHLDNWEEDSAVTTECQFSPVEAEIRSDSSEINKPEEIVCVKQLVEAPIIEAEGKKELPQKMANETVKASEVEAENVKLDHPKESVRVSSINKETNAAKVKKEPVLPRTKAWKTSTPRVSRPTSTPTKTPASSFSTKMGNSPSLSKIKNSSTGGSKRIANKSLDMSLGLNPSDPDPPFVTTLRRSFIMEKMGDKDIVKRVFKTFQNNFNEPKTSGEGRTLVKKQVPAKRTETKISTSMSTRIENGRPTKVAGVDKRSGNSVPTTLGLKSDTRVEKRKEFLKKSEEQSNGKEAERTRLQSKSKEEKHVAIRHFKATPMPGFYRGQKISKSSLDKESLKVDIHR
ncbi:Protein WVD2-like 7 [Quillaja saponaria]|nr:Protein WVD2-like 7 [Quillaja saponaria]